MNIDNDKQSGVRFYMNDDGYHLDFPEHFDMGISFPTHDYSKIKKLTIRRCPYPYLPPNTGNMFKDLKFLSLEGCRFKELPDSFGILGKLKILRLRSCKSFATFPDSIGMLRNLKVLDVSWSAITGLPPSIGELTNLKILRLWSCLSFRDLPRSIEKLHNLKELKIQCDGDFILTLPASIGQWPKLEHLIVGKIRFHNPNQNFYFPSLKTLGIGDHYGALQHYNAFRNISVLEFSASIQTINSLPFLPQLTSLKLNIQVKTISNQEAIRSLDVFDANDWKESSILKMLDIYVSSNQPQLLSNFGNMLRNLPKTLQSFSLFEWKITGMLDILSNVTLPQGISKFILRNCSNGTYSKLEKNNYIRDLVESYTCLGIAEITDPHSQRYYLPKRTLCRMKYNQCGHGFLMEKSAATTAAKKTVPLSVWPVILARVPGVVRKVDVVVRNTYQQELEPSILFQLLQNHLLQNPEFLAAFFKKEERIDIRKTKRSKN